MLKERISAAAAYYNMYNSKGDTITSLCGNGMTFEQAEAFMEKYRNLTDIGSHGPDPSVTCNGNTPSEKILANCVAFSRYFLHDFTTKPPQGATGNGGEVVGTLAKWGFETGKEPRPYAIFSVPGSPYGHTGVVLGLDGDEMIIGEANCKLPSGGSTAPGKIQARRVTIANTANWTYAYTDGILKLDGLDGN
jgi:hypothetical protein